MSNFGLISNLLILLAITTVSTSPYPRSMFGRFHRRQPDMVNPQRLPEIPTSTAKPYTTRLTSMASQLLGHFWSDVRKLLYISMENAGGFTPSTQKKTSPTSGQSMMPYVPRMSMDSYVKHGMNTDRLSSRISQRSYYNPTPAASSKMFDETFIHTLHDVLTKTAEERMFSDGSRDNVFTPGTQTHTVKNSSIDLVEYP